MIAQNVCLRIYTEYIIVDNSTNKNILSIEDRVQMKFHVEKEIKRNSTQKKRKKRKEFLLVLKSLELQKIQRESWIMIEIDALNYEPFVLNLQKRNNFIRTWLTKFKRGEKGVGPKN